MDETQGYPVSTGVVVAGENMVSIDAVASAIMGLDSKTIRHITLAAERRLGIADLDKVTVIGASIESVAKKYRQGFSLERLKKYGFDCKVGEEVLRPLWERVSSDLPSN